MAAIKSFPSLAQVFWLGQPTCSDCPGGYFGKKNGVGA
jgi:hypothetical protein